MRDAAKAGGGDAALSSVTSFLSLGSGSDGPPPVDRVKDVMARFGAELLESFEIDSANGGVVLRHNPLVLSARQVADELKKELGIGVDVEKDGASGVAIPVVAAAARATATATSDVSTEPETVQEIHVDGLPKTPVLLAGIFWLVSLLSLLGGPWCVLVPA